MTPDEKWKLQKNVKIKTTNSKTWSKINLIIFDEKKKIGKEEEKIERKKKFWLYKEFILRK